MVPEMPGRIEMACQIGDLVSTFSAMVSNDSSMAANMVTGVMVVRMMATAMRHPEWAQALVKYMLPPDDYAYLGAEAYGAFQERFEREIIALFPMEFTSD